MNSLRESVKLVRLVRGGNDEYSLAVTVVGDGENAETSSSSKSSMPYLLLLLIPAAIVILIASRRAKRK